MKLIIDHKNRLSIVGDYFYNNVLKKDEKFLVQDVKLKDISLKKYLTFDRDINNTIKINEELLIEQTKKLMKIKAALNMLIRYRDKYKNLR